MDPQEHIDWCSAVYSSGSNLGVRAFPQRHWNWLLDMRSVSGSVSSWTLLASSWVAALHLALVDIVSEVLQRSHAFLGKAQSSYAQ